MTKCDYDTATPATIEDVYGYEESNFHMHRHMHNFPTDDKSDDDHDDDDFCEVCYGQLVDELGACMDSSCFPVAVVLCVWGTLVTVGCLVSLASSLGPPSSCSCQALCSNVTDCCADVAVRDYARKATFLNMINDPSHVDWERERMVVKHMRRHAERGETASLAMLFPTYLRTAANFESFPASGQQRLAAIAAAPNNNHTSLARRTSLAKYLHTQITRFGKADRKQTHEDTEACKEITLRIKALALGPLLAPCAPSIGQGATAPGRVYTAELPGGTFDGEAHQTLPLSGTVNGKGAFTAIAGGPNRGNHNCSIDGTFKDNTLIGECTLMEHNGAPIVSRFYSGASTATVDWEGEREVPKRMRDYAERGDRASLDMLFPTYLRTAVYFESFPASGQQRLAAIAAEHNHAPLAQHLHDLSVRFVEAERKQIEKDARQIYKQMETRRAQEAKHEQLKNRIYEDAAEDKDAFCVRCLKGIDPSRQFCTHCGAARNAPQPDSSVDSVKATAASSSNPINHPSTQAPPSGSTSHPSAQGHQSASAATPFDLEPLNPSRANIDKTRRLGRGGFAEVYAGTYQFGSSQTPRAVAYKMFHADIPAAALDPSVVRELKIGMRIKHENLVRYYGIMQPPPPDNTCLVMELLPDGTLYALLQQNMAPLEQSRCLTFAQDIASGMHELHAHTPHPIIHRDLKAQNVLLWSGKQRAKVADFGLAKPLMTSAGTSYGGVGTLAWSAPETFDNEFSEQSDIFSFGVVLYEILTRRQPYFGKGTQSIMKIVSLRFKFDEEDFREDKTKNNTKQQARWLRRNPLAERRPDLAHVPISSPLVLRDFMERSWADEPSSRPTFQQIINRVSKFLGPEALPLDWDWKNTAPGANACVPSEVFMEQMKAVLPGSRCRPNCSGFSKPKIKRCFRIENLQLWRRYCQYKSALRDSIAAIPSRRPVQLSTLPNVAANLKQAHDRVASADINEFWLWHGTRGDVARNILGLQGFDARVANMGGLYGAGNYFADQACKSHQYTQPESTTGVRHMLYCRVVMGAAFQTKVEHNQQRRPPGIPGSNPEVPCDSIFAERGVANSGQQLHNEYVTFASNDQIYPAYIIEYTV